VRHFITWSGTDYFAVANKSRFAGQTPSLVNLNLPRTV